MKKERPAIQQFREAVYRLLTQRADATIDLLDALTVARHVDSPVALSEEIPFRRRFSSAYDVLKHSEFDQEALSQEFYDAQPADSDTIAGYEVYAVDTTPNERPEAETAPDRGLLKSEKNAPVRIGHKYSWLARLVKLNTSWVAPQDITRVPTSSTDSRNAAQQVEALDKRSDQLKVVVGDSLYGNAIFLAVFQVVSTVFALVRLRSNRVLYESPGPRPKGKKGAPRKHGPKFKLSKPRREPDRTETFQWLKQTVRLRAWHNLHFYKLPQLVGLVLCIEFLKADGSPRYKRPIRLFWTGPITVPLADLCRMYLWRFAIEHAFRFFKQHLGLNVCQSTNLMHIRHWMWLCALAYWQLLLIREVVVDARPAWHPRFVNGKAKPLTPGNVQRAALRFLLELGTPAALPRRAGKGKGRPTGYRPAPRKQYPVVRKSQKTTKTVHKVGSSSLNTDTGPT